MHSRLIQNFLKLESSSGILLFMMAIIAMIWVNSPLAFIYKMFTTTFLFWINEGLMAFFFLIVALELKREYLDGNLSHYSQIILPAVASIGGMLIPALLYVAINYHDAVALKGWATPIATDVAFTLGVLSLFGRRIPITLKLFLLPLAIFDDLGAIIIIALFFSHKIAYLLLLQSLILLLILFIFNLLNIRSLLPYLLIGIWLWLSLLHSGIHPAITGFLVGLMIPDGRKRFSPLRDLEKLLHPWVAYLIMPLFALANAGFSFDVFSKENLLDTVVIGIIVGLFIGKQLGVFGFSWLMIRAGFAKKPEKSTWLSFYGISVLCGIGFTMSLFLGTLSFQNTSIYLAEVRLGVIMGSILSGIVGAIILIIANRSSFRPWMRHGKGRLLPLDRG